MAWKSTGSVLAGHVAWVESVSASNLTVEQYNATAAFHAAYGYTTVAASSFTGFVHFKDISGDENIPNLTLIF